MNRRAYWRTKPDYIVECQGCQFEQFGRNALGLAAQHHDRTGHVVRVETSLAIYYGEDQPGRRRWWKA